MAEDTTPDITLTRVLPVGITPAGRGRFDDRQQPWRP